MGGYFLVTHEAETRTGSSQARLTRRGLPSSDPPPPTRLGRLKVHNFFRQCSPLGPGAPNTGAGGGQTFHNKPQEQDTHQTR